MKGFKQISCTLVVIILFVDIAVSVPLVRVKRQDLELENDAAVDLNPIVSEVGGMIILNYILQIDSLLIIFNLLTNSKRFL